MYTGQIKRWVGTSQTGGPVWVDVIKGEKFKEVSAYTLNIWAVDSRVIGPAGEVYSLKERESVADHDSIELYHELQTPNIFTEETPNLANKT